MADGKDYRTVTLAPAPALDGLALDQIALYAMSQSASPTAFGVENRQPQAAAGQAGIAGMAAQARRRGRR